MTRLVIDTDPGIDDALALLLALGSPDCSLEAIATVAGNVPLPFATRNARRVLAVAAPERPPVVAPGAARPLLRDPVTAVRHHGLDGLGDALPAETTGPVGPPVNEPYGPLTIVEMARRFGRMLTIAAIGPLTNIAHALELDSRALSRIHRLVVMGGAVGVGGNVTPAAEFNMHADPDAAARVLEAGLPVELVPLDVTQRVILRRSVLDTALGRAPRPLAEFVLAFTRFAFRVEEAAGERGMPLHDPLAVGVALDPSFVGFEPMRLRVGADGETRREAGPPNCRVAVRVDPDRFLPWFLERLCRACS
jgi:inosine-uridine nucleoside N-ribohydrolase